MKEVAKCSLCGEPMPEGEETFAYHGYSGPCPKKPLKKKEPETELNNVSIVYKNHRGEVSTRRIIPKNIRFESTEWHPEPQWILEAFDVDKQASRSFAMKDIQAWNPFNYADTSS